MRKLSTLAAICVATLFVSVCVGLMTARPTFAQVNGNNKDVRVVNTTAEAIPVRASTALPVAVNSLPAVQVSSLPAVQVSSLPAVQVGNNSGNPVPVSVVNLPSNSGAGQLIAIRGDVGIQGDQIQGSAVLYTAPAGKVLVVETVDYQSNFAAEANKHQLLLISTFDGVQVITHVNPDGNLQSGIATQSGYEKIQHPVGPGSNLQVSVRRNSTTGDSNSVAFTNVSMTGRLYDAP